MSTVVVGVDGSDNSRKALAWAVEEARAHGSVSNQAVHRARCPVVVVRSG